MFIRFSSEGIKQIEKFYEYTKNNKNIIRFIKLIGDYQMAIYFESLKEEDIIKEIKINFSEKKILFGKELLSKESQ